MRASKVLKNSRFASDQEGSQAVEFVIWLPLFMVMVGLIIDVTMLLATQSRFYDVARDASRQVALGIATEEEAIAMAKTALGDNPNISVTFNPDSTFATSVIAAPYSEMLVFGDLFAGDTILSANISMIKESAVSGESNGDDVSG